MLVNQIDHVDRDRLRREARRDHPHRELDRAIEHLNRLGQVLNAAVTDAEQYWSSAEHIWSDTRKRPDDPD